MNETNPNTKPHRSALEVMLGRADEMPLNAHEKMALKNAINTIHDFMGDPGSIEFAMEVEFDTKSYADKMMKLCALIPLPLVPYVALVIEPEDQETIVLKLGEIFTESLRRTLKTWFETKNSMEMKGNEDGIQS